MGFYVKTVTFQNGERFLNLIGKDGIPLYWPAIWSIVSVRGRNKAVNTIEAALRAVKVLYDFLEEQGIDLEARLQRGVLFSLPELELLLARMRLRTINKPPMGANTLPIPMQKRGLLKTVSTDVSSTTLAARIHYIAEYLKFRGEEIIFRVDGNHQISIGIKPGLEMAVRYLKARSPRIGHASLGKREGLAKSDLELLLSTTDPLASNNPWKSEAIKFRNSLIIQTFLETGMRRGELLNLMVSDINFNDSSLVIKRRPDDIADPRRTQPLVKTAGREVPISENLTHKLRAYIFNYRANRNVAKKHGYLFTSHSSGRPLSLKSVNEMFGRLRNLRPEISSATHPHVLRHTWNDEFSRLMDENKISPEREHKLRAELMGWSPTSKMPSVYTRRHTKEQAKNILRARQEKWMNETDK